jgi:hypothetical protein
MYHLLKGLYEYLRRYVPSFDRAPDLILDRKEEFSVIIIGLDGAGKTVSTPYTAISLNSY